SSDGRIALIHNGVIENYAQMKRFLLTKGYTFQSETDTEVLCNLIAYHYAKGPAEQNGVSPFLESVRKALRHVEGTYGIVAMCVDFPGEIVAAREASPLILGVGDGEYIIASDASALISRTQNVVYLKDGELVHVTPSTFSITTRDQSDVSPVVDKITWSIADAEKGQIAHFMEKEIFEQPAALENAMRGRFSADGSTAQFGGLNVTPSEFRQIERFMFCACGTAWHACLVTEHLIERFARVPVEVDYASEFRYRNSPLDSNTLFFVMSQSGETIDTLAALREAKRKGHRVLAVSNVVGSSIAREADGGIYQHVGPEIGVASTKAFTSQLLIGAMIALYLGRMRDMSFSDGVQFVNALKGAPDLVRRVLQQAPHIREIARRYAKATDMLFLGRLSLFPLAP
ncbi:MAG TPA: isomerizing glutamine--fructose-6-phosphate transaminase, partial [Opitutus sp.]|nr:isomerizing glutamine--fructose-6-phosphate transaminase [Opitutus sp.]